MNPDLSVVLLHEDMFNKQGALITASLTLIDVHDIARSGRTYGAINVFIAHPSETLRKLALTLKGHWEGGFGSTYNPNRKDALSIIEIVENLDAAIMHITARTGRVPRLIATSARDGGQRTSFPAMRDILGAQDEPFLLMLGTGWGMSEPLLTRAKYFLEPLKGPSGYNHLSVRSACAIMLDRLLG